MSIYKLGKILSVVNVDLGAYPSGDMEILGEVETGQLTDSYPYPHILD